MRVFGTHDNPLFVAADVCACLEIKNPSDAIGRLDSEDRGGVVSTETNNGVRLLAVVTESGLYALVLTSRKPEAKAFKRWVTSEVLPATACSLGAVRYCFGTGNLHFPDHIPEKGSERNKEALGCAQP